MFFVRPQAAHPIAAIALGGYTFFMGKGKGSNGTCTPIGSALGEQGTLAERYGDDLPSIQRRLGEAVRRDGSTPQLAELTAPASEEELEALARRYGSSLEGKYGQLTQRRQARNRSEARMDKLDAFSRMVDMNVISGSALVQFSRLAGMVLRHHPDPRARSRAAEILIMVNQRGAIEMAGKWFAMVKSQGFSRDELLSACQEGLLEAAEERDQKRRRLWKEYDQAKAVWLAGGGAESGDREPMPPTEEDVKVFDPEKASFYTYAKLKMYMRCQRYVEQNSGSRFGLPIPTALYHQLSTIIQERASTEEDADRLFKPLLAEYEHCRNLREDKMIPAALADAKKRAGGKKKPMVVSALLEGYPEDVGQARLLANRLAREYGVPAAVGVVDAQGVAKVSWAAPNDKLAFGQRALDQPKLRRMAKQACSFEETDEQGNKSVRYAVGGHTAVLSGSCPKEKFEDFVAMGEEMGEQVCRQKESLWRKRPWTGPPSAFCDARMVGPERIHRIATESKRLAPISDFRKEPRVSEAVRLCELGEQEPGSKSVPAVVELSDGSRHPADLSEDVKKMLGSGTWFEAVLSPSRARWYISTVAPLS